MVSRELSVAIEAARAAAQVIRGFYGRRPAVRTKADRSPVTEADVRAEEAILAVLRGAFPEHGFYGEESGRHDGQAESLWLVDPIDGTQSFIREMPFFSTQIALMRHGALVLGVSNAPLFDELAWAERGCGAFLNDRPIRVSAVASLAEAFVSTGNLRRLTQPGPWRRLGALLGTAARARGYGDFAHYHLLARGALDVVVESDVNILDIAALAVLVRESGGRFTDLAGAEIGLDTASVLATNGLLHAPALAALSGADA
jgi:histidinol-phosphatase